MKAFLEVNANKRGQNQPSNVKVYVPNQPSMWGRPAESFVQPVNHPAFNPNNNFSFADTAGYNSVGIVFS